MLGGVGFTVALLIAELAFEGSAGAAGDAKAAVLVASVLAAVLAAMLAAPSQQARAGAGSGRE